MSARARRVLVPVECPYTELFVPVECRARQLPCPSVPVDWTVCARRVPVPVDCRARQCPCSRLFVSVSAHARLPWAKARRGTRVDVHGSGWAHAPRLNGPALG